MVIRELERKIKWQKADLKLPMHRRRAIVFLGYSLLKLWCWNQAEYIVTAEDIDEVSLIDGFSEALLSTGYAEKENDGFISIERFSPENITKKNKLAADSHRKREERRKAKDKQNVLENSDARPDSSFSAIDNDKQYNKQYDKTYNKNTKYNNSYSSQRDDKIPESNTSAYCTGKICAKESYSIKSQQTAKLSPEARVERLAQPIESQNSPDDDIPF